MRVALTAGMAGALDCEGLGEVRDPEVLELPAHVDDLRRQTARVRRVDDLRVAPFQRHDLVHPATIPIGAPARCSNR